VEQGSVVVVAGFASGGGRGRREVLLLLLLLLRALHRRRGKRRGRKQSRRGRGLLLVLVQVLLERVFVVGDVLFFGLEEGGREEGKRREVSFFVSLPLLVSRSPRTSKSIFLTLSSPVGGAVTVRALRWRRTSAPLSSL
jgi:hypothetical protein